MKIHINILRNFEQDLLNRPTRSALKIKMGPRARVRV